MAEWNLNQVAPAAIPITQSTGNKWSVDQSATAPLGSSVQQPSQQWEVTAQQWNVDQPASAQAKTAAPATQRKEEKPQWNMSVSAEQSQNSQWNVVQQQETKPAEVQPSAPELPSAPPTQQEKAGTKPTSEASIPSQKEIKVSPKQDDSIKVVGDQVSTVAPSVVTESASPVESPVNVISQSKVEQVVAKSGDFKPDVPASAPLGTPEPAVPQPQTRTQEAPPQEPTVAKFAEPLQQPPLPSLAAPQTTSIQPSTATLMVKPHVPPPGTSPQSSAQQPTTEVTQPSTQLTTTTATQQSGTTVAPQHVLGASSGAKTAAPQTAMKATAQVSMHSKVTHEGIRQAPHAHTSERDISQPQTAPTPQQAAYAGPAPAVKPKPHGNNHELKREGGEEFPLEEKQKGVFWLGPDLEGWVDKTKALKEEFRRQSDANEMYFVKNLQQLDLKTLNTSEDPSKMVYNVLDQKGVDVVNLIRCILNEHHHSETGPFFFQFGEEKRFKLELLPTATQPGNGLVKSVGRRKYYTYPDICDMLKSAGVTSKGLGIMLQKLNTSGLKPALHNQISPMNELHFMLLFEIARRLVRGPHGFSLSTEPEFDHLPIGITVARMITMFCRGSYCLNYEAVFGVQDKFNPFIDNNVVLRRQKIYSLNKLFYDAEIRSQARDNPYISKFLKYHNGYIVKTTKGFMDELDMAFRGF